MLFILGNITGLLEAILMLLILLYLRSKIERILSQTQSKLKQKGAIIEPEDTEVEEWKKSIQE